MKFSKFKLKYILQNQRKIVNIKKQFSKFGINKRLSYSYSPQKIVYDLDKTLEPLFNVSKKKRERNSNVKFLIKIRSYRGSRHKRGLPSRGQRTHTNAKTSKKFRYDYSRQKVYIKK